MFPVVIPAPWSFVVIMVFLLGVWSVVFDGCRLALWVVRRWRKRKARGRRFHDRVRAMTAVPLAQDGPVVRDSLDASIDALIAASGVVKHTDQAECQAAGCGCMGLSLEEIVMLLRERAEKAEAEIVNLKAQSSKLKSEREGSEAARDREEERL